jgi:hypothetical protein
MIRRLTLTFIIGCALLSCVSSLSADDNSVRNDRWDLELTLDAPDIIPPAVQWAIFDTDPVHYFRFEIFHYREVLRKQLRESNDEALSRRIQATATWDGLFNKIKGDQVYLLYSKPNSDHSLTSNGNGGARWIVTKTRNTENGPYCWRLPVNLIPGHKTKIVLSESNAFNLDSLYSELMK